jgi:hypothetical protein
MATIGDPRAALKRDLRTKVETAKPLVFSPKIVMVHKSIDGPPV